VAEVRLIRYLDRLCSLGYLLCRLSGLRSPLPAVPSHSVCSVCPVVIRHRDWCLMPADPWFPRSPPNHFAGISRLLAPSSGPGQTTTGVLRWKTVYRQVSGTPRPAAMPKRDESLANILILLVLIGVD